MTGKRRPGTEKCAGRVLSRMAARGSSRAVVQESAAVAESRQEDCSWHEASVSVSAAERQSEKREAGH